MSLGPRNYGHMQPFYDAAVSRQHELAAENRKNWDEINDNRNNYLNHLNDAMQKPTISSENFLKLLNRLPDYFSNHLPENYREDTQEAMKILGKLAKKIDCPLTGSNLATIFKSTVNEAKISTPEDNKQYADLATHIRSNCSRKLEAPANDKENLPAAYNQVKLQETKLIDSIKNKHVKERENMDTSIKAFSFGKMMGIIQTTACVGGAVALLAIGLAAPPFTTAFVVGILALVGIAIGIAAFTKHISNRLEGCRKYKLEMEEEFVKQVEKLIHPKDFDTNVIEYMNKNDMNLQFSNLEEFETFKKDYADAVIGYENEIKAEKERVLKEKIEEHNALNLKTLISNGSEVFKECLVALEEDQKQMQIAEEVEKFKRTREDEAIKHYSSYDKEMCGFLAEYRNYRELEYLQQINFDETVLKKLFESYKVNLNFHEYSLWQLREFSKVYTLFVKTLTYGAEYEKVDEELLDIEFKDNPTEKEQNRVHNRRNELNKAREIDKLNGITPKAHQVYQEEINNSLISLPKWHGTNEIESN